MPEGGGRVQFDFEGSLQLARQLWSTRRRRPDRGRRSGDPVRRPPRPSGWGPTPTSSSAVGRTSGRRAPRSSPRLREDARLWAEAWARALDQQNKNNRAAEVERVRDDRGMFEKGWDSTFGEDDSDDQVPMPEPVSVPTAPSFLPTATEITY